ncbi:MAG: RDD family protein [Propionibacteriaceae bacterium]|nr:RDD family protein [Propionibacteriaceae bacterium]
MSTPPDLSSPPQGWYPDPARPERERYWDGIKWTQVVRNVGSIDLRRPGLPQPKSQVRDPALDLPLAGWWRKVGSGIADTVIAWVVTVLVLVIGYPGFLRRWWDLYMAYSADFQASMVAGGAWAMPGTALQNATSSLTLVAGGVTAVYCVIFLGTWGATLGQRICGIKAIKAPLPLSLIAAGAPAEFKVEKPGWLRSMSKGFCWALLSAGGGLFVIIAVLNAVMPLWHRRKQSVTDVFANTVMVRSRGVPPQNG